MEKKCIKFLSFVSLFFGTQALAQQSPYLKLYQARLTGAEQSVAEAKIDLDFENKLLTRLRPLVSEGIISKQRYDEQDIKTQVARIAVDNLNAEASQAKALFDVNKLRIDNGLEVPVCPEGE